MNDLHLPGTFTYRIVNRENISKTAYHLVTLWTQITPTNLVLSRLSWCSFGAVGMEIMDLLDGMDENRPIL